MLDAAGDGTGRVGQRRQPRKRHGLQQMRGSVPAAAAGGGGEGRAGGMKSGVVVTAQGWLADASDGGERDERVRAGPEP